MRLAPGVPDRLVQFRKTILLEEIDDIESVHAPRDLARLQSHEDEIYRPFRLKLHNFECFLDLLLDISLLGYCAT
jgi:hypothetical protein